MSISDRWRGEFGDDYTRRNPITTDSVRQTAGALAQIWCHVRPAPRHILEVGANLGRNLLALSSFTESVLHAIEPNASARDALRNLPILDPAHVYEGDLSNLPLEDSSMDLVFTSGVLIHVPEAELRTAYEEIHRVANTHILSLEYFATQSTTVPYRGNDDMLWKRDFGSLWLDWFDLEPIAEGFLWNRTTGQDDLTWWLFRKP